MLATIFILSLVTDLVTGLGALPFFFVKNISQRWIAYGNAIAAGFMLGASALLGYEGFGRGMAGFAYGFFAGMIFIALVQEYITHRHNLSFEHIHGASGQKMLLIVGAMTLHSIAEGVGIGVSFAGGEQFGLFIALAMAIQNIPEGLAIALVLVPKGISPRAAFGWAVFSSLPQAIMAVPAFLFVDYFKVLVSPGLGFAAGVMVWMCCAELLPDARQHLGWGRILPIVLASILAMLATKITF